MHVHAYTCARVHMCVCVCELACASWTWRSENNVWELVLPSTMWDLETEFRLPGLEANLLSSLLRWRQSLVSKLQMYHIYKYVKYQKSIYQVDTLESLQSVCGHEMQTH